MASAPNSPESTTTQDIVVREESAFSGMLHLPRNVYLLLFFTLGKGFQLSISALTLNYYVHSLGYRPDFIGVFSAMPAVGALIGSRISPFVVRWQQVDPCTILKYSRYE